MEQFLWNPSAIEGQTDNIKNFMNRTLGMTLNEFAPEFYRSLKSLLAETKCYIRLSLNILCLTTKLILTMQV